MKKISSEMPIKEFLDQYQAQQTLRLHMPGHKGKAASCTAPLDAACGWDITEIAGADSLFEADGILLQGEAATAAVYQSGGCCWSAGGSTLCIQAMLAQMRAERRQVIAARTVHRAFLNSCILLGLEVTWVYPRSGGILSGTYAPEDFEDALRAAGGAACVYVTSPDYLGNLQDIAALAAICHAHDAPLLVDNAHGAHLAFLPENRHPMALGADYCCDSAHKTLPALTGAAYLHCRDAAKTECLKRHMQLFGSTSPSYLILQSLESCTAFLQTEGKARIRHTAALADALKARLSGKYQFLGDDPFHLTIAADGLALAEDLRRMGAECEYADHSCIVLLLSPMLEDAELARLEEMLQACEPQPAKAVPPLPPPAPRVCDMRTAALAAWELCPLAQAEGRVCGPVQVPCPPAVPICISGERLTKEWLAVLADYGIAEAAVLREWEE